MENFLGQITLFACNYAPKGWAPCAGQLLPLSQNTALFSLLGTAFGGDGRTTFGLPDLRGRVPNGQGQGPGLALYAIGESGGSEAVTLTNQTIPPHSHALPAYTAQADLTTPEGALLARGESTAGHGHSTAVNLYNAASPNVSLAPGQVAPVSGGGQPHPNLQPLLAATWCIALSGNYPPRQ